MLKGGVPSKSANSNGQAIITLYLWMLSYAFIGILGQEIRFIDFSDE